MLSSSGKSSRRGNELFQTGRSGSWPAGPGRGGPGRAARSGPGLGELGSVGSGVASNELMKPWLCGIMIITCDCDLTVIQVMRHGHGGLGHDAQAMAAPDPVGSPCTDCTSASLVVLVPVPAVVKANYKYKAKTYY